jgi:hypothetical protein
MKPAEYERLTETLQQVIADNPPDNQIVRHSKGLLIALYRWMAKVGRPAHSVQARVTATLVSSQEQVNG